jgi:hypothetical protein
VPSDLSRDRLVREKERERERGGGEEVIYLVVSSGEQVERRGQARTVGRVGGKIVKATN